MELTGSSKRIDIEEIAKSLHDRNQRYLDSLKQSGDPSDSNSRVLATILDTAADGLIVLDKNLKIVLANAWAAKIANWQLEDVDRVELRRNYQAFYDDGITPVPFEEEPIEVAMRERRPHEMEMFITSPHLEQGGRWIRTHAAPVLDDSGEAIGGVSVFSDITERLRLQRERDCLVALIGHDIKNHFAAEQACFDFLLGSEPEKFEPDTLYLLNSLRAASERFVGIANSLLEMSRTNIFANSEFGQEVDLSLLAHQAIELSELVASERKVRVSVECMTDRPIVRGLPGVICHVLHNIIQNAIEASNVGSTVTVNLSSDSKQVSVKISDTGIGMSTEELAKIFSPHRVAGHVSKTTHSTGFGLYLSAMLVEGQGGQMKCASELGKGTTFTILMPAFAEPAQ